MRREPVEHGALQGLYVRSIKLSDRMRWQEATKADQHMMVPSLLSICVVDESGSAVRTVDEWDDWGGENMEAASAVFNQCITVIGSVEAAAKK